MYKTEGVTYAIHLHTTNIHNDGKGEWSDILFAIK